MPLIRHRDKVALFVHIPKTGGTSVEDAMAASGALVALKKGDRFGGFMRVTFQHLDTGIWSEVIPPGFYDYAFATVRHPLSRLVSEYFYRRKRGFARMPFDRWVNQSLSDCAKDPYVQDNHIRPQLDFLAEGVETFRIEDGIDKPLLAAAGHLGLTLAETDTHNNRRTKKETVKWRAATRRRAIDFYAEDFDRFGYDPEQEFPDLQIGTPRLRPF